MSSRHLSDEVILGRFRKEAAARISADSSLKEMIGDTNASFERLVKTTSERDKSEARVIERLKASLATTASAGEALVESERLARVTATEALAEATTRLSASLTNLETNVTGVSTAQETLRAQVQVINGEIVSSSSHITALESVVYDGATGLAATAARLTTEETTRASQTSALASRATALEAEVSGASNLGTGLWAKYSGAGTVTSPSSGGFSFSGETVVRLNTSSIPANRLVAITYDLIGFSGATLPTFSVAGHTKTVSLTAGSPVSQYVIGPATTATFVEIRTAAGTSGSFAHTVIDLMSSSGAYREEINARAAGDSVLASRATTLESELYTPTTGLIARISTVETTKVDASGAYAQATSAISASLSSTSVGTIGGAINTEATVRATADGYATSKYTLKTEAIGSTGKLKVTGMNLTSASGPGTDISDVVFTADRFRIYNSETDTDDAIFQVDTVNNVVRLSNTTRLQWASIDGTGRPSDNADVTLSAVEGGLTIASGGVTLRSNVGDTGQIKSGNYSAGSAGWAIKADGSAEFSNITARGTMVAGDSSNIHALVETDLIRGAGIFLKDSTTPLGLLVSSSFNFGPPTGVRHFGEFELATDGYTGARITLSSAFFEPFFRITNGTVYGVNSINNTSNRYRIGATSSHSLELITADTARWLIGSTDGHLKSLGDYDIRKSTPDGWSIPFYDGSNYIEFRWDSSSFQIRIDKSDSNIFTLYP